MSSYSTTEWAAAVRALEPSPVDREQCLAWAVRMRTEYLEMPGLSLTARQASRLWQLECELAASVLSNLALQGFLRETPAHRFVRA